MKKLIALITILVLALVPVRVYAIDDAPAEKEEAAIDTKGIIFEHLGDAYGWEVPFSHELRMPLPVIVRDYQGRWHCFSSARLAHGATYDGFMIGGHDSAWHGKVVGLRPVTADGMETTEEYRPLDLSITKNVAALFITVIIVAWMILSLAHWHKKRAYKAPRRGHGSIEALVEFIYNGVIKATLGDRAPRYAPYLLTVFFFILVMNLLGLIVIFPGGANLTGNIAVTLVLALITFFITNLCGTRHYWKEIFWPDVPWWLKAPLPIMQFIEVFGIFTKPAALTIRLFANMLGGHIVVLVLTLLIFILGAFGAAAMGLTTVVSVCFVLFMLLIDVLVSFIQAYVFTMLSTLFIALSTEHGEHEKHETAKVENQQITQ